MPVPDGGLVPSGANEPDESMEKNFPSAPRKILDPLAGVSGELSLASNVSELSAILCEFNARFFG